MPEPHLGKENRTREVRQRTDIFMRREGRRPRILVSQMTESGHRQWSHAVAAGYADLGFDVDIGPVFQNPVDAATMAVENDVHVLTVPPSSTVADIGRMFEALKIRGGGTILVVVGDAIMTQTGKKRPRSANAMPDTIKLDAQVVDIAFSILDALELKNSSID